MRAFDIIKKKRDNLTLLRGEILFFIDGIVDGSIADYQASAFLMAIWLNGMTDEETFFLTDAMMHSGSVLDFSEIDAFKVDKHSTGGVGDKISLTLAPVASAGGVYVPMLSGRGLGHTGGTLDKLDSIPGFRTSLSLSEFKKNVRESKLCIMGQTNEIAPADRILYALRDELPR